MNICFFMFSPKHDKHYAEDTIGASWVTMLYRYVHVIRISNIISNTFLIPTSRVVSMLNHPWKMNHLSGPVGKWEEWCEDNP